MHRTILLILVAACLLMACGCKHGDFKAEVVMKGQPAPFTGYNVGPDLYVVEGQPCPVAGAVVWIKGLDPNDIVGEE